jgi:hypothetical protein
MAPIRGADELARYMAGLEARIANLERGQRSGQLRYSTVDNGTLTFNDGDGNPTLVLGLQSDGTHALNATGDTVPDTPPSTPTLIPEIQALMVAWNGEMSDASTPLSDFQHVEVHSSADPAFTPDPTTLQGALATAGTFRIGGLQPGQPYYVALVTVNAAGNSSEPSAVAVAVPLAVASGIAPGDLTASQIGNLGVLNENPYFAGGDSSGWTGRDGAFSVVSGGGLPAGAPYRYGGSFIRPGQALAWRSPRPAGSR